jgi:uncharacterized protein YjcR
VISLEWRRSSVSDEPKYRDEEWLREEYVEKRRTAPEMAEECGCAGKTVRRWLKRHGIGTRSPGQPPQKELADEDWLREQYAEKERSTVDIADECGCYPTTVAKWLRRHGIETRRGGHPTPGELTDGEWLREEYVEKERTTVDIADECGCASSTVAKWLRRHRIETRSRGDPTPGDLIDEGWLREEYVEKERTTRDIADECGCAFSTVGDWLRRHGIKIRPQHPEGEHHPNWNGGSQPYGPGWNASKRRTVRERDGHTCQDPACSVTQDDHLAQYDEKLHVHHLIKARDLDDPEERNAAENLITLCRDCHQRWERMAEAGIRPQIDGVTGD